MEFDPGKEEMKILHPRLPLGTPFKFLVALVDCKLIMDKECDRIVRNVRPKMKAILRTRFFNICLRSSKLTFGHFWKEQWVQFTTVPHLA